MSAAAKTIPLVSVQEAKTRGSAIFVDVRRPDEYQGELGHIEGAHLFTLETDFEMALTKLPKDQEYIFVCRSGARSARATEMAMRAGFSSVSNMEGGMLAWNEAGFPVTRD